MENDFSVGKKWGAFDAYLIAFFLFILFATIIASLMEYGVITGDLGPIHRYIGNFNARLIIILIGLSITLYLYFTKWKKSFSDIKTVLFWGSIAILFDTLGNLLGFYAVNEPYGIWWYDKFVHFISPLTLVFCFYPLFGHLFFKKTENKALVFMSVLFVISLSSFWEVYEYMSDRYLGSYMVGGVDDIIWDLFWNSAGAIMGGIIYSFIGKKYENRE